MKRFLSVQLVALALACIVGGTASAQVFTPTFTSPRLLNDIGIYISDAGGGDLNVEGIWHGGPLGLRVGYVDAAGGLLSAGAELRSPIDMATAPIGLVFTAAGQALIGDENAFGLQAGLSAGYTFIPGSVAFTPYIHPRLAAVRGLAADDFEFELLAEIGTDIEFWNNLVFRLGIDLSDVGSDWGVGVAIRR